MAAVRSALLAVSILAAAATAAGAQPYARFAVPDRELTGAVRAAGTGYEAAWNALFVATLRAERARADSAGALAQLATRVAAAETEALGTSIGADALRLSRRWSREAKAQRVQAAVAESLGVAAVADRRFADADRSYGAALEIYRRIGERRRAAWMLGSLGVSAFRAQDYARADSLYGEALAARRALGDARMIGASLNDLGGTRVLLQRPAEAYRFLIEARAVRERIGDTRLAGTLNSLALDYEQLGRPDSASLTFARALEVATSAGDSSRVLDVVNNLARHRVAEGDAAGAIALGERGLSLARSRGDRDSEAHMEEQIGAAFAREGRYPDAAEHFESALAIYRERGDARAEMTALIGLGRQAIELQDASRARAPLERAAAVAESLGDASNGSRALNDLAIASRLEGDSTRAASLARRALDSGVASADSALVHDAAVTLGQFATDRGDHEAAAAWFARARGTGSREGAAEIISDEINLGGALAHLERLDPAEAHFREAQDRAAATRTPELLWPAWLGLGDVAERRGDYARALDWDRRAATLIDTLRARQGAEGASIVLLSRRLFAFEALIHLLGKLAPQFPDSGYDAEAFAWAERTRARSFLDLLNAQGRAAQPLAPVTLERAQSLLPTARGALLEYSLGDSSSSLWVVTRSEWKRFTLPPRGVLQARAEILRRELGDPATAESRAARNAARALHRLLIAPAAALIERCDQLVISPDGALARVPFEALLAVDAPADAAAPRGAYLVERYAISYTPSASALATFALGRGPGAAHREVLAVGAPEFGAIAPHGMSGPLAPLPSTAGELTALRALAAPRPCTVLSGAAATRERVLALPSLRSAGLIHIATHGLADPAAPERSGLWFSAPSDSEAPGFVSLDDLFGLRLSAGLVTLSACETGLGRIERGEGVIGLSRAFLAAGARSVVVSLWSVNDRSTAALMRRFYAPLLARSAPRASALAEAKRALLAEPSTRSPFYWAAFVLIGAAGRLD